MPNDEEARPATLVARLGTTEVTLSQDQATVTIGGDQYLLSPTQSHLLTLLLSGQPKSFAELAETLYQSALDPWVHQALLMHIKRLRHKLRGTPLRIYAIPTYGFILLPDPRSSCGGPAEPGEVSRGEDQEEAEREAAVVLDQEVPS